MPWCGQEHTLGECLGLGGRATCGRRESLCRPPVEDQRLPGLRPPLYWPSGPCRWTGHRARQCHTGPIPVLSGKL